MPPKEQKEQKPSKKAVREKKANAIEDATFGLKNKNKSKKVQQFINRVEKSVKNSGGGADAAKAKEAKKDAKLAKELQEEELRVLFNEGLSNQFGKKKSKAASVAEKLGVAEANEEVTKFLETLSSDESSDDEDDDEFRGGDERHHHQHETATEAVAVEIFRVKTIEDIIEEQRAKLAAEGKAGTPVNEQTFAAWRAQKLAKRRLEMEARMKAEQLKRKGGKGLSVLSGKELFSYNASLFIDDDAALDEKDEGTFNAEKLAQEALEEAQARMEAEKAQAEQRRLAELARIEAEYNRQRDEDRRLAAARVDRPTFTLDGIVINQVVFDIEDKENLDLFDEEIEIVVYQEEAEPGAEEGGEVGAKFISSDYNENAVEGEEEGVENDGDCDCDGDQPTDDDDGEGEDAENEEEDDDREADDGGGREEEDSAVG